MDNSQPLFKSAFPQSWETLPVVLRKRYANRPYSNDKVVVRGMLNIKFSRVMKLFLPLFRLAGALVPYAENNVPVTVNFNSSASSAAIQFDRVFYFANKKPYHFSSRLEKIADNIFIEFMHFGLGWKMNFSYNNNKVTMSHQGYICRVFGKIISLPLTLLIGKIYAEEQVLSDKAFRMLMQITHPIFGKMFEYGGEFTVAEERL